MTDIDVAATNEDEQAGGSRRDLLGKAAIAAVITTVAGLSISRQAGAVNGDIINVGATEVGTALTSLTGGSSFQVTDGTTAAVTGTGAATGSIYGRATTFQRAGVMGWASGTQGWGVYGKSSGSSGRAIYGLSVASNGVGVYGEHNNASTSGYGVIGVSNFGVGVYASGTTVDLQANGSGRVLLSANGVANPPAQVSTVGTIAKDAAGNMWVCVASGNPGQWRKLAGPASSGSLHLLAAPTRVYDSRAGEAPAVDPKTPLANLAPRTIDCKANSSGVPAGAKGVLLNVTAISVSAGGFLAVTPGGAGFTGTSTLNWTSANAIIANSATSACGANATIDVTAGGGGSTNVLVDVFGYYL